ncbi:cytochrome c oxidase assembly protein [Streptomyces coeruleorubidus]|uniref:cytochrome c oxidase assembly protein n=1 Tax=Streptomyces coeruleorubidus TaxID=116188 RepID=UPI0036C2517D
MAAFAVPWESWLPPFTAHMAAHLTAGMAAPIPVVLSRPVTLALRVLPLPARRALVSLTRSRLVTALLFPPVAAALDIGGLWLLYRAPLPPSLHHSPLLLVHLFLAGTLFTFALLAVDPATGRASPCAPAPSWRPPRPTPSWRSACGRRARPARPSPRRPAPRLAAHVLRR